MFEMKPIHIGILVKDIEKAMKYYSEIFHIGPWQDFGELQENALYYGKPHKLCYRAAMAPFGSLELELIQPTQDGGVFADDLKAKGEGMHHVCIEVEDIEKNIEECKAMGFDIVDYVPMYEMEPGFSLGFIFINSDKVGGMKLELVQQVLAEKE